MPYDSETLLELGLSRSALDRSATVRKDSGRTAAILRDPTTRILDLYGDRAPYEGEPGERRLRYRPPEDADTERLVAYLGAHAGVSYACAVRPAQDDGEDSRANLRSLGMELDDLDVGVLAASVGLANWHAAQGFCPRCGSPTEAREGGWVRVCTNDGSSHFPRTDPAVIMAVVDEADRLLLARGPQWRPTGMSVLAGFVEPGESLEAAVAREVMEEVGVEVDAVRYRGNQPWPFPSSLMIGFRARATTTELHLDPEEIADARWFARDELAAAVAAGEVSLSPHLSIARHLIEDWYGGRITEPQGASEQWSRRA
ncbi:NAD(+) diphosphatase [Luteipulveratus flavus]|uniref:NAD(+) diphosphatase n=1 Tax=Luteipulveratus flavus TaxID=3031728 RepID=A0ABT6C7X5_9MICO|nr:NAD(+) diphosphatase [Luteipulveratus sp. YIM 133296]MDF8265036.1 NAD(+) diphosphatase [Luteipulveratus sp. YIM 133296]